MSIDLKSRPELGLYRLRNRFSILLALARRHLSPVEFSRLLRMQGKGDLWLLGCRQATAQQRTLARQLDRSLDRLLQELEGGEFPRTSLWEASRQYGKVFGGGE